MTFQPPSNPQFQPVPTSVPTPFIPPFQPLFQYIPYTLGRWKRLEARFHAKGEAPQ